jgi:beta-glucanase (GH16 family)
VYGSWPLSGEIDIMEAVNPAAAGGNNVYGSIHYGNPWPNNQHQTQGINPSGSVVDGFHTYAMEWEPGEVRMYVDGVQYARYTSWFTASAAFPAPFNQRFHWVLNLALGGNWPGAVDASMPFPARFEIDYVRVYRKR